MTLVQLYIGPLSHRLAPRERGAHTELVHLLGDCLGPRLLAVGSTLEDALSEYDERFGERVTNETTETVEQGLAEGELRYNDGGTLVLVDPYEWMRSFASVRSAAAHLRALSVFPVEFKL